MGVFRVFKKIKEFIGQAVILAGIGYVVWNSVLDEPARDQVKATVTGAYNEAQALISKAAVVLGLTDNDVEGEAARVRTEAEWDKLGL